jgi:hypothetical protein
MTSLLKQSSIAVCLRGFSATELEKASKFLSSRGHRVVRSLNAAQCMVTGPDAENCLLESSRAQGLEVVRWSVIEESIRDAGMLSAMTAVDDVPLAEEAVHPLLKMEDGSRRNLIATLQLCSSPSATSPSGNLRRALSDSIQQIYLNRYPDAADRKAILSHLRAADLA